MLLALAVAACSHAPAPAPAVPTPKLVFGEQPPVGCGSDATSSRCFGWYLDHVLVEIAVTEVPDPKLEAYVTSVGNRLARAGGVTVPMRFRVIDDLDPQAESFTGGAIYVWRGALLRMRNEAELAALLGHEMGHVIGGHAALEHQPAGLGREDEIQADEQAVRLVAAAGYDPRAVETMLRALAAGDPAACDATDHDEHPCMRDRIARVQARIGERRDGELGVDAFRAGTATMVAGDDPLRAAIVDGAFVFGHAGLTLQVSGVKSSEVDGGRAVAVLGSGETVVVTAVPRELGELLHAMPPEGQAFALGDHGALWIIVVGGYDTSWDARQFAHAVRDAYPAELAGLKPKLFDASAERKLWPPVQETPSASPR